MNIITLTGNATRDIELKYNPSGVGIANGTIAVRRDFKDKQSGEYETDFINYVVIGKLSEVMANYIKKGDKFGISGRLQIRKWEHDGKTSYFTEVIVNSFDFPDKKKQGNPKQQENNDPFSGAGTINIQDDDLPF